MGHTRREETRRDRSYSGNQSSRESETAGRSESSRDSGQSRCRNDYYEDRGTNGRSIGARSGGSGYPYWYYIDKTFRITAPKNHDVWMEVAEAKLRNLNLMPRTLDTPSSMSSRESGSSTSQQCLLRVETLPSGTIVSNETPPSTSPQPMDVEVVTAEDMAVVRIPESTPKSAESSQRSHNHENEVGGTTQITHTQGHKQQESKDNDEGVPCAPIPSETDGELILIVGQNEGFAQPENNVTPLDKVEQVCGIAALNMPYSNDVQVIEGGMLRLGGMIDIPKELYQRMLRKLKFSSSLAGFARELFVNAIGHPLEDFDFWETTAFSKTRRQGISRHFDEEITLVVIEHVISYAPILKKRIQDIKKMRKQLKSDLSQLHVKSKSMKDRLLRQQRSPNQ